MVQQKLPVSVVYFIDGYMEREPNALPYCPIDCGYFCSSVGLLCLLDIIYCDTPCIQLDYIFHLLIHG
jgi:hypothetical protein